jgi:DNA-binding MarR family transcriptional regulator
VPSRASRTTTPSAAARSATAKPAAAKPAAAKPAAAESGPNDAAVLLSKLGHRAKRLFTQRLGPLGLKPNHVQVLAYLSDHPGASQRDLVESLRVTPSTIVELIDELEGRGLAVRDRNPQNRRASVVSLTRRGRAMLVRTMALSREVEAQLLAPLGTADRDRLLGYLRILDQHR